MAQPSVIPQKLMTAALLHFTQGVPIDDCDCEPAHRNMLARVDHVYWVWKRNPWMDTFGLFQQLVRGKYSTKSNENRVAHADQRLFDFVVEQISPPSRKIQEERVRHAANHLMQIGMQTDNTFAIEAGMKAAIKLDRLDQPESEQADISKVAFLPSVVVTDISEIDDSRQDISDEETKRIIAKYGAYVDEKRQMIEDQVALMEAKSNTDTEFTDDTEYEQDRVEPGDEQ